MKNHQYNRNNSNKSTVPEKLETLKQFYQLMELTRKVRQDIFQLYEKKAAIKDSLIRLLQLALERLKDIPYRQGRQELLLYDEHAVPLDLGYETGELEKDIFFLTHPFRQFYDYLAALHPGFGEQVKTLMRRLKEQPVYNWITDRDGTVNNYCGRYKSSIQSLYNALFLTQFARSQCAHRAVILTSAPLMEDGLLDVSITPSSLFVYAGSKGRDFMDDRRMRHRYPVNPEKQARLNALTSWLKDLVADPRYEIFSLIGSGLQYKLGETTIAYQDVSRSIPEDVSESFVRLVNDKVHELDQEGRYFKLEKTGTDLEIVLTLDESPQTGSPKEFDKGDGIRFINQTIDLKFARGLTLVCGDTAADLAMVKAVREGSGTEFSLFVTEDKELQQRTRALSPTAYFVSSPDVLVTALYLSATQEYDFE